MFQWKTLVSLVSFKQKRYKYYKPNPFTQTLLIKSDKVLPDSINKPFLGCNGEGY